MVDKTICKFRCSHVKDFGTAEEVRLDAQYDQTLDEDRRFAQASPSGHLEVVISNPAVRGFFQPGKTYYLEATPAE